MLSLLLAACTGPEQNITVLTPTLVVSPEELAFGDVVVDYPGHIDIELINAGRAPLRVESIAFDAGVLFTLDTLAATDDTADTGLMVDPFVDEPFEMEPEERLWLRATFSPETYLDYTDTLVITSNDPERGVLEIPVTGTGSDGPTPDIDVDPLTLDFDVTTPGSPSTLWFTVANVGDGPLTILETEQKGSGAFAIQAEPGDNSTLAAGATTNVIVLYNPTTLDGDNGTYILRSDDPDEPEVTLNLLGNGGGEFEYPEAVIDCPDNVSPPDTRVLDGSDSNDPNGFELVDYDWTLETIPNGSGSTMTTAGVGAEVFFDIAGGYKVTLVVENEFGVKSAPAECVVDAVPQDAVHIELLWNTERSDLDLHMLEGPEEELFDRPHDVCFCNTNPDWGSSASTADDPRLDLDDRSGYGPENINIESPADGDYPVRVHYFDPNGAGDTVATVRFYIDGVLAEEFQQTMDSSKQVWNAGIVRWPQRVVAAESEALTTTNVADCY